ncbi:acyl-CoA dehydrogenase [Agathobaculum sp. TL06]
MNKYFLTEEQENFRNKVRDFALTELAPHVSELDQNDRPFPAELMRKAAEIGLLGITMPKEYGGLGADTISQMIAIEELHRVSPGFAQCIQGHAGLASILLHLAGTDEQKKKWLIPAVKGENFCSFALTEKDAGSDSAAIQTTAVLDGDEWVLNGSKRWIANFNAGGFFVVAAKTDMQAKASRSISMFCVDASAPGLKLSEAYRKLGCRASPCGTLEFENCRIPRDCLIGEQNRGFPMMMQGIDIGRLGIAAAAIGIAQEAYTRSVAYAKQRVQFGKPICEQQVIAFYLAEMAMEIDIARTMLYRASRLRDMGMDYSSEAAAVKVFATEMGVRTAEKAIQIHGGNGYSEEYVVEMLWRDAKLMTLGEGTTEICKLVLSRQCLKGNYGE